MKIILTADFKNVWILSLSCALAGSIIPLMVLVGSLVGAELAPSAAWATTPIALMILGTALAVIPVSRSMQTLGRKKALWLFMGLGILGCGLAMIALQLQSFIMFCLTSVLLGTTNTALLQTRFIAMESVAIEHGATAASMVMAGGIIAAFVGPELAVMGRDFTPVSFQGSFLLAAACISTAATILSVFEPALIATRTIEKATTSAATLLRNPSFCLVLSSGVVAYVIMSFVMTGTPISMHHFHAHSLLDTKWVIQSHIAAMFLPSFVAPLLFKQFKIRGVMILGLVCYCATIFIGFSDTTVGGFWLQLVFLGVGWNFLFVAGTSLLPSTHHHNDRFKAQAVNDFAVFSCQAAAALSVGWAINLLSWQQMLLSCLIPICLMVVVLIWEGLRATQVSTIEP